MHSVETDCYVKTFSQQPSWCIVGLSEGSEAAPWGSSHIQVSGRKLSMLTRLLCNTCSYQG